MITIIFNKPDFEYDVHSLVKAFFPQEDVEMFYTCSQEELGGRNVACTHHEADELAKRLEEKDCNQRLTVEYLSELVELPVEAGGQEQVELPVEAGGQEPKISVEINRLRFIWWQRGIALPEGLREEDFASNTNTSIIVLKEEGISCIEQFIDVESKERADIKNILKLYLYELLEKSTGQKLPWGTLTGIRPTKIPMKLLDEGKSDQEVFAYMKENYLASDEKINLSIDIAKREQKLLSSFDYKNGYSLYIGIPFCPSTCLYCSFTSYPLAVWKKQVDEYLDALIKEIDFVAERFVDKQLHSVYIGGGTPTTLEPYQLERLICKVQSSFDLTHCVEFTVEAGRPDSITREKLQTLHDLGIDRISVNPQTMKQATLDLIGRHHTVEDTIRSFHLAREVGFQNINMDLIMGLPEETIDDVRHTMEVLKELDPDNITIHSLAIKRAARLTIFKDRYQDMQMVNTQAHMDLCAEYCKQMGLSPYYLYRQKGMAGNMENVGYAKAGKAGVYNILIMEERHSIVACGAGASTKRVWQEVNADGTHRIERAENVKDVRIYIDRIDEMIERKRKLLGMEP